MTYIYIEEKGGKKKEFWRRKGYFLFWRDGIFFLLFVSVLFLRVFASRNFYKDEDEDEDGKGTYDIVT